MSGNNGGPWGGGGNRGKDDDDRIKRPEGGRRPDNNNGQMPELDQLLNKGREQFRVLLGGGGNGGGNGARPGDPNQISPRSVVLLGGLAAIGLWAYASFYQVRPEEQSIELLLGRYYQTGGPGLNFAPWPVVTAEVIPVTTERTIEIGTEASGENAGLMLTGDENIVDIDFQVVWNIKDTQQFLFNLADPAMTIEAVSESAMREIIAQSQLAPILNRDRGAIGQRLTEMIQSTLDTYDSGVHIVRVNFDKADPPEQVKDAFFKVQDAEQQRGRVQNEADAYSNRVLAEARGNAAQMTEQAEAYRAQVINEAQGEASRFSAILTEYKQAPEVTRRRIYLETMEKVMGEVDMTIIDDAGAGQGVVPYLPLDTVRRPAEPAAADATTTGGN